MPDRVQATQQAMALIEQLGVPHGVRFLTRGRVFSDEEWACLRVAPKPASGDA